MTQARDIADLGVSANNGLNYEEGTWIAQMFDASSGGNGSSTTVTGYYTKIGKLVTARFWAMNDISTSGLTGTNIAYFTLPLAASSIGRSTGSATLESVNFDGTRTVAIPTVSVNQNRLQLTEFGDNVTDKSILVNDFNGTSSDVVTLSITYAVD